MSDTERDTISPVPVSPRKLKGDVDSSDDESSEIVNNGGTDSSSTDNGEHLGTNGVADRVNGSATDSEEDMEENEPQKHEPVSNGNGFTKDGEPEFKPKKHNMATAVDKEAIKEAYNEVMADKNGVEWAAFTFTDNKLGVTATGDDFDSFKSHFGPDDRGFGYIKIMTGDEMSKRSKFVLSTWVGPNVSVMKKAKMSTDKALMKEIIQNLSVELQIENANEFSMDHFKAEVDKAGGAR
eukprot:GFUD01123343.1.p1 GENE.GFUD01123343.1~~GFUD01123343.1.p1  ORF type:complete len:238 (+),score=62.34 GFUD01123343.1:103-816(+)